MTDPMHQMKFYSCISTCIEYIKYVNYMIVFIYGDVLVWSLLESGFSTVVRQAKIVEKVKNHL